MLESYFELGLIVGILLRTIPAVIVMILIVERVFKNKFETSKALQILSWILISNGVLNLAIMCYSYFTNEFGFEYYSFDNPYAYSYWIMAFCATLLPLTLLIKKIARSSRYLFLIAILINSGHYLERYTIIVSTIARDYETIQIGTYFYSNLFLPILKSLFVGAILTAVLLFILEITSNNKFNESIKPLDADLD